MDDQINKLAEVFKIVDRRLKILNEKDKVEEYVGKIEMDKTLFELNRSSMQEILWLPDLIKEKYLHIILCIIDNDRPKNKFSLVAFGRCAFYPIMEMQHHYACCSLRISDNKANPMIDHIVNNAPTIEELKTYAEKYRKSILARFMVQYEQTKKEYEETVGTYTLKDFEPLKTIRKVSDADAPIVLKLKSYKRDNVVRIYEKCYYSSQIEEKFLSDDFAGKSELPTWEQIIVDNVIYVRLCRTELMTITQDGNTMFGDWWSTHIQQSGMHGNVTEETYFNKENWERSLSETKKYLMKDGEERYKKINWNPPQITWIRPDLIPPFSPFLGD